MKTKKVTKVMLGTALVAVLSAGIFSCKKKNDSNPTTPTNAGTTLVSGEIKTNTHWTADQHYLLSGYVYVDSGATLTIDAGTVVKGDKATKGALIVEQGAKLIAQGTASNPIIFTSNQPAGSRAYGDWGGVILCGYAPTNWMAATHNDGGSGTFPPGIGQVEGGPRSIYGGTNANDNSGTLSYVRIEFGGVAFSPNNEVNGLSLCGTGAGTTLDHIQVSFSGDDSYEFFGGTVNAKYIIAHRSWDDDFDTDNGYSGTVQFGMILRDPACADYSGSHSFESDSRDENATALPITKATFCNVTTVGPLTNPNYNGYNSNFVCGEVVRRSSSLSVFNSLIIGWPLGIIVDEDPSYGSTVANIQDGDLEFKNSAVVGTPSFAAAIVARTNDPHSSVNSVSAAYPPGDSSTWASGTPVGPFTWFKSGSNYFGATEGTSSKLTSAFNLTAPNFIPASSSSIFYTSSSQPTTPLWPASFTDAKLANNSFIDKTPNYIGAFGTNNWASGWTNFDPQNADYGDAY